MPLLTAATDSWLTELEGVRAYHVTERAERDEARRMQAAIYAKRGPCDIADDGMVHDAWVDVAHYFVVRGPGDRLLATCRLIPMTSRSLPTVESDRVSPEWRRHLLRRKPHEIGEVASLAVDAGEFSGPSVSAALYRALFHYTMSSTDHLTWVTTMDRLLNRFTVRFLGVPSTPLGEPSLLRGRRASAYSIEALAYLRKARDVESDFWNYLCRGLVIDLTGPENRALSLGTTSARA